jgi:hypothetical protein
MPPALAFSDFAHHQASRAAHARRQMGLLILGGHVAVFGDSLTKQMPMHEISPFAEDYCIYADSLGGLVHRLRGSDGGAELTNYAALANAAAVILGNFPYADLCVSSPNLSAIQANYATLLDYFTGPLVIIPPVPNTPNSGWNSSISAFNSWLKATYVGRVRTVIVEVSDIVEPTFPDGHLRQNTVMTLTQRVRAALRSVG